MSQVYNDSNKRPRRSARTQRNRPVLVTGQENEVSSQPVQELSPLEESAAPEIDVAEPAQPKGRRLPNFFSSVAKRDSEESKQEEEAAQARIARAARSKTSNPAEKTRAREEKETRPAQETNSNPGLLGALLGGGAGAS